jgi:radical SAM protein with 4Fe4S-binding SPASM domain
MRYRFENFGGIIASEQPPFLAYVDQAYMQELGLGPSPLWEKKSRSNILSAPTEVHLAITNRCTHTCNHCYMDSGEQMKNEMDLQGVKKALKALADFGVFHVALGGGEALLRSDLIEIAGYAREVGLVPNLTISGNHLTKDLAGQLTIMGQINVSVDAPATHAGVYREKTLFQTVDRAIDLLLRAGVPTGINCVVGKDTFPHIPGLFSYARSKGVNEIEFLRFKPVGRGRHMYRTLKTTPDQNTRLVPMLAGLSQKHNITAKIDCSFIPMLCIHQPSCDYLQATATYGCEAGNVLIGAKSDGQVNACSFLPPSGISVYNLAARWEDDYFEQFRRWHTHPPAPCDTCEYLTICKGGCHAVSLFYYGDIHHPDPGCPRVAEYNRKRESS